MECPGIESEVRFIFNSPDTGYLVAGKDSFALKPVYQGNWKPMQTFIGVQLIKGEATFAVLYTFTGLARKKIFLYTLASEREQLLCAAYMGVIARYL